ncbi:MAG TPA: UxaA family hydrolase [Patescibacteria group bacterium]|nr:UxaA family hydrolase [Patescibacteria group bacterium]
MKKAIQIDGSDNVATVTSDVVGGASVEVLSPEGVTLMEPVVLDAVPFGHKLALRAFSKGDEIVKYGEVIGVASGEIRPGEWVHTHNVESARVPTSAYEEAGR